MNPETVACVMHRLANMRLDRSTPDLLWNLLRDRVVNAGIKPKGTHILAILTSYYHLNQTSAALKALRIAHGQLGVSKLPASYTIVISMLSKDKRLEEAKLLLDEMRTEAVAIDYRLKRVLAVAYAYQGKVAKTAAILHGSTTEIETVKGRAASATILYSAQMNLARQSTGWNQALEAQKLLDSLLTEALESGSAELGDSVLLRVLYRSASSISRAKRNSGIEDERLYEVESALRANRAAARRLRANQATSYLQLEEILRQSFVARGA